MKFCKACFVVLFFAPYLHAQFYIDASAAYGFPAMKQCTGADREQTGARVTSSKGKYFSYGSGFSPALVVGAFMGKHFSAELGYSSLYGAEKSYTSNYYYLQYGRAYTTITRTHGNMMRLIPGIRFSMGKNRFTVYNSAGFVIGFAGKLVSSFENMYSDSSGVRREEGSAKIEGGWAVGFSDALGVQYKFGNLHVLAEVRLLCQDWAPLRGNDAVFSNPATQPSLSGTSVQYLKQYYPFSSFGCAVGIGYSFGKKNKEGS